MCAHDPACPPADAIDWWAARTITAHRSQGWTLLCNGALVFDDRGALLPHGKLAALSDAPWPRRPDGGPGSPVEQMHDVFHELHGDGRHVLCAVCDSRSDEVQRSPQRRRLTAHHGPGMDAGCAGP
jgi:hypothetical protein